MKMAYVMFDGVTTMDFAGFYEVAAWMKVLGALEDLSWTFCADKPTIVDDRGMSVNIPRVCPDLSAYDLVFVPGGMPTRTLRFDAAFMAWLGTARDATYKASVCTGALLLGAAGFLEDRRATTNASAYELLRPYCAEVVVARTVRDGNIFTGGGAGTSLDLGLAVTEALAGCAVAKLIQEKIDYPFYRTGLGGNTR